MEPPIAYDADDIRSKKMDVLHALQSIPRHAVSEFAARGQYGEGCVAGEQTNAYRQEKDVAPDSNVETFAALKAYIDNWRWQGVPFYMRTGKRLTHTVSEISISNICGLTDDVCPAVSLRFQVNKPYWSTSAAINALWLTSNRQKSRKQQR